MALPYAALAQAGIGAIQAGISAAKAANLPDPKEYTVSPELRLAYNMARRRADEGYSAEERAAFEQMLARNTTSAKRMFQNVGLAGAGSAAANIMGIDALNQFAAQGANIRRSNFGQFAGLAGQVQDVNNMETGRFNQRLMAEEQALGQGIQSGIVNMFGGIQSGMNFAQNEKAIGAYAGMNQPNTQVAPTGTVTPPSYFNQTPSPTWNTFETQGAPFLPQENQFGFYNFGG